MNQSDNHSTGVLPPRLRPGDTVAVCSPASPVQEERLRAGVDILAQRYKVVVSEHALARRGFLAGSDDQRADEFNKFLHQSDVRAIVLARGGYGILRILDRLDADALRRDPKLIVGYSDATALLGWALRCAGVRGIHGPMTTHIGELGEADQRWLFDRMESIEPAGLISADLSQVGAPSQAIVEGRLHGGNLCLLSHLVGTPYEVNLDDGVLFVEEIGERPYAIDRFITHLALAGRLGGLKGALVGDFVKCEEKQWSPDPDAETVVSERLTAFGVPGLGGLPVGHGARNLALPFGARCEVDFGRCQVRLLEAAVS